MTRSRRLPAEALEPYLVDVPHPRSPRWRDMRQMPQPLVWSSVFGNHRPVEIEVGFGKGMYLANAAQARPEVNFLGVEIERKYVLLTANRLAKLRVTNVRLACTDARWLLRECLAADSVQAIHVYFPDPWWKQRHQKRKLFSAEFSESCAKALVLGGALEFVTDVGDYFEAMCALLAGQQRWRRVDLAPDSATNLEFLTHFERKYRVAGRTIYRARFIKSRD